MNIEFEHNGTEYVGQAEWDAEKGFTARLVGHLTHSSEFMSGKVDALPDILPIVIDRGKRGLLIRPRYTAGGTTNFSQHNPLTRTINIAAWALIRDIPWQIPDNPTVESISVKCNALDMWYGDNIGEIESNFSKHLATARFALETDVHKTCIGTLEINSNVTIPGFPHMGTYVFKTGASACVLLEQQIGLEEAISLCRKIEGYFDLLAAFPSRSLSAELSLTGIDRRCSASIAIYSHSEASTDHPYRTFLNRGRHTIEPSFSNYLAMYDEISFLQNTLRMLAKDTMMVPEGFLTACNVIESLAKNAPNSNEGINEKIALIKNALDSISDENALNTFELLAKKLPKHPSFKDKFSLVKNFFERYGFNILISQEEISKVRGKYRHDILAVKSEDLETMQSSIGLAWLFGLLYLCSKIGISNEELRSACTKEVFHIQRNTGYGRWGGLAKTH